MRALRFLVAGDRAGGPPRGGSGEGSTRLRKTLSTATSHTRKTAGFRQSTKVSTGTPRAAESLAAVASLGLVRPVRIDHKPVVDMPAASARDSRVSPRLAAIDSNRCPSGDKAAVRGLPPGCRAGATVRPGRRLVVPIVSPFGFRPAGGAYDLLPTTPRRARTCNLRFRRPMRYPLPLGGSPPVWISPAEHGCSP